MESETNDKNMRINKNKIKYMILEEEQKKQFKKLEIATENGKRYS